VLSRRVRAPAVLAVFAALVCLAPAHAQAAGVAGISSTLGLVGALLVLLALQSSAGMMAPLETLGAALVLLTALALLVHWRRGARAPARSVPADAVAVRAALPAQDAGLLAHAREQFVALQAAWDRGDIAALGALTTAEMLDDLLCQLPARGPGPNRTDVLSLDARLLAVDQLGPLELASIEFSGIVCESLERGPVPFREVWMLARSGTDATGTWRLARQQALL
jgi:hypothetical protein